MSMPTTITLISPSKTTLISHPPPEITTTNACRDASFSTYLDGAEESFVLKLGNKKSTPNNDHHVFLGKKSDDDIELDVFGAEKYFNEPVHHHNPKPAVVIAKNQLPTHHHHRPKKDELALEIFAIKPPLSQSIRSESSWNSRSSLLQAASRNIDQQQPNKKTNKKLGFLARIGCKCSCADKSSVDVDDDDKKPRGGAHFVAKRRPATKSQLQVFGGPNEKRSGLEKKLAMMTRWDAVISPEEVKTIPSICGVGGESDGGDSDASSDLFEIESLSRGGGSHDPFRRSTSTTCYAPSEASVEWSVVTASAADFDEPVGSNKEMPRLRSAGILSSAGCMSQKAVRVGGGRRVDLRTESFTSSTARFHEDEIKFNRQRSGGHLLHAN